MEPSQTLEYRRIIAEGNQLNDASRDIQLAGQS